MRGYIRDLGKFQRDIRLYWAYTLFANVSIGVFMLVFNLYLIELGLREDFIGLFSFIQTLAMALTAFSMGKLVNRFGVWRLVTVGVATFLCSSVILTLITNEALLLLLAIFWGASNTFVFTTVMPFVVELTRTRERQQVSAVVVSLTAFSSMIGSLLGGWAPLLLALMFGFDRPSVEAYRGTMYIGIAVAALSLIPLFLMSEQRKRQRPSEGPAQQTQSVDPDLPRAVIRRRTLVFVMTGGLMSLGGGAIMPFYNVYLSTLGASAATIGIVFAGASLFAAVIGLGAPYFVRRLGSPLAATVIRCSTVPLFILMIFFPVMPLAISAHWIRNASQTLGWSIESTYVSEVLPRRQAVAAFGYRSGAWNVGYSLAALASGWLIVQYGYAPTFALYAIAMSIAFAQFYPYFRDVKPWEAPVEQAAALPLRIVPASEAPTSLALEPGGRPMVVISDEADAEQPPPKRRRPRLLGRD
jgi:MFS family permease